MAADEERLEILRMVQGGQIGTDEAAELLDALEEPARHEERHGSLAPSPVSSREGNKRNGTSNSLLAKTLALGAKVARRANVDLSGLLGDVK